MPSVKPNEKRSEYVSRCIAFVTKEEGLDSKQAAGKCFGLWKQHLKNKRSKGEKLTEEELKDLETLTEEELNEIVKKI